MKKTEDIDIMISFISECAEMEGTEMGESWVLILKLHQYGDYIGKTLHNALEKEIAATYTYLKKNAIIEEKSETITRTFKTLLFKDDF